MNTLRLHAAIAASMASITDHVAEMAAVFQNHQARSQTDDAFIDLLSAQAQELLSAAQTLKQIELAPPPAPPPPPDAPE